MTSRNLQLSARFVSGSVLVFQMQAVKAHGQVSAILTVDCRRRFKYIGISSANACSLAGVFFGLFWWGWCFWVCFILSRPSLVIIPLPLFLFKNYLVSTSFNNSRLPHSSFSSYIRYFTMSKSYQNLLFASLFLFGHLLFPAMSLFVPGSTCPNGKVQVCCYGTPFVCFAWTWPCDEYEVEQCCARYDVCLSPLYLSQMHQTRQGRQSFCNNLRFSLKN